MAVMSLGARRAIFVLGLAALAAILSGGYASTRSLPSPTIAHASSAGAACPLTPAQEKVAVLAFEEMMPVVRHPRCLNCHGGVNPFVPYDKGGHFGGAAIDTVNGQIEPSDCEECHSELPGWRVPHKTFHFVGKTSRELCIQFKTSFPSGPDRFVAHIEHEPLSPQFIKAAFKGDRALDFAAIRNRKDEFPDIPFLVQGPPESLSDLVAKAIAWGTAVGRPGGWPPSPECGCEIRKKGWVGTVTAHGRIDPWNGGALDEKLTATILFELDPTMNTKEDPAQYWKATSGSIRWNATATGRCTGSFSGTTPLPAGFDPGNLPTLRLEPGASSIRYTFSVGPWLDTYYPIRSFSCTDAPPLPSPQPQLVANWWSQDPAGGVLGEEAEHFDGTHTMKLGAGFLTWSWSFSLNSPP